MAGIEHSVCPECGGKVFIEEVDGSREWVCSDCGNVSSMEDLVVESQMATEEEDCEVEEL